MLNVQQLRESIIRPCLEKLQKWSQEAEELLVLTCAQESRGGTFVKQVGGPALGIYQMEPMTHDDLWSSYLPHHPNLSYNILNYLGYSRMPSPDTLVFNLGYATMMTRVFYLRVPEVIPSARDIPELAKYWNVHYNCNPDKGTDEEAIIAYNKFVGVKK